MPFLQWCSSGTDPFCRLLQGVDLLVHAAGPFQRRTECNVLEACIAAGVPYMDICDDADYTQRTKLLHQRCAAAAGRQEYAPCHAVSPAMQHVGMRDWSAVGHWQRNRSQRV